MTTLDVAAGSAEPRALLSCASQVSYITDDIDAFEARLRDRYGVERFLIRHDHSRNSPGSSGAILHLGLALVDGIELEIIQPNPAKPSIYRDALALNGGVGRFHHINHRLNRREQWREAEAMVARLELPVELQGGFGEDLRFSYPDARADLGHFLEFSYMEGAAAPSFPVPENRPAPGASLFGGCFQRGYVTSDLEAAVSRLAEGYGVSRFERAMADGCEVARAWTGRFLLELIQPTDAAAELYGSSGPELMRLHHLGFAAADEAAFDRLVERARGLGLSISPGGGRPEMREMYVDARAELGHHLKYVAPAEAARRRYVSAPRN
jgi:hypothetical protein